MELADLNAAELDFLFGIEFSVMVQPEEYARLIEDLSHPAAGRHPTSDSDAFVAADLPPLSTTAYSSDRRRGGGAAHRRHATVEGGDDGVSSSSSSRAAAAGGAESETGGAGTSGSSVEGGEGRRRS